MTETNTMAAAVLILGAPSLPALLPAIPQNKWWIRQRWQDWKHDSDQHRYGLRFHLTLAILYIPLLCCAVFLLLITRKKHHDQH